MEISPSTGGPKERAPLSSFPSTEVVRDYLKSATFPLEFDQRLFERLVSQRIPPLLTPGALGFALGVSPKLITAMARFPDRYYRHFKIKKRDGGQRLISAPRTFLKTVQKFVLDFILATQPLAPNVTGFVRGRGIFDNASFHVGAPYLLNVDIKDFFGSIRVEQIFSVFKQLGFPVKMAHVLSRLCSYKGVLPQGAPTSPCLANLVFRPIDTEILLQCRSSSLKYTRYADDLTFSSSKPVRRDFLNAITKALKTHGFEVNAKKVRFARPGQAKYVTGFVVNESVHPSREVRKRLRAMFHNASKNPDACRDKLNNLAGWASFVKVYDRRLGRKYSVVVESVRKSAESKS
jgi:RNA-directed DNA polymerase